MIWTTIGGQSVNKRAINKVLLGALGLIIMVSASLTLSKPSPNFSDLNVEKATALSQATGVLISLNEKFSEMVPEGKVISQSHLSGERVWPWDSVELVVSKGRVPIPVPNLVGKGLKAGGKALEELEFRGEIAAYKHSYEVPAGKIISQEPKAGKLLAPGKIVSVVVSDGPEKAVVPKVIGLDYAVANAKLEVLNLSLIVDSQVYNSSAAGTILYQSPSVGKLVDRDSVIRVVISMGEQWSPGLDMSGAGPSIPRVY